MRLDYCVIVGNLHLRLQVEDGRLLDVYCENKIITKEEKISNESTMRWDLLISCTEIHVMRRLI